MKNKDTIKAEFRTKFADALKSGDEEAMAKAFADFSEQVQDAIMKDVKEMTDANDQAVLAARGARVLTSEETKFYQVQIERMKAEFAGKPMASFDGMEDVLPETVIERVFDDITSEHPLLSAINFQNTGALVKIILGTSGGQAVWGELCDEIKGELKGGFKVLDLLLKKLSAFVIMCKAMLDLGPVWLDRFIREILMEALMVEIEVAVVANDGKTGPIGMIRKLSGATDGKYPKKDKIVIENFDPETVGGLLAKIAEGPNGKVRPVPELLLLVNPIDYFTKVMPATTIRATDGTYRSDVFPYNVNVIQSVGVDEGEAVVGLASRYFLGLGTAIGGKLEFSDEYKFIEDQRTYIIKLYGNGTALDENAFLRLDIKDLEPAILKVKVVED